MDVKPKNWGEVCFKDTHINNMFIKNYLAEAPGDFLKVYLYFMMQIQTGERADISSVSSNLNMPQDLVLEAINSKVL